MRARRGVVFASGGFTHDDELVRNFQPGPIFGGCAVPTNQGDFVRIAESLGARLGHMQSAWRAQVVLEQALQFSSTPDDVFMPPGDSMILVNRFGRRVVDEKSNYNERTRIHFVWDPVRHEWTNLLLFMVYDQRTAELFGGRFPLPAAGTSAPYVIKAESWPALGEGARRAARRRSRAAPAGCGSRRTSARSSRRRSRASTATRRAASIREFSRGERIYDRDWHAKIWSFANQGTKHALPTKNVTMYPFAAKGPVLRDRARRGHARHERRTGDRPPRARARRRAASRSRDSSARATASLRRPGRRTTRAAARSARPSLSGVSRARRRRAEPVKELG